MKTLYININNELIQSNEELEVLNYDLDSDFFFYLGEKFAKDCKVENENALITDFNTQENEEDYKQIIAQWKEIKGILFGEECEGKYELTLPNGYIHWLRYNEKYNDVYDKNFSHGESVVITIDLEELYEDSVEYLQRIILRILKQDDLYRKIDEIVFNDDAVTRKSTIVRTIKDKYEGVGFKTYKEWLEENKEKPQPPHVCGICKKNPCECFEDDTDGAGNQMSEYFDVFGLIVGKSTENDVRMIYGENTHSLFFPRMYKLHNISFFINYQGVVDSIIVRRESKNSFPQFYKNIGLYWDLSESNTILVFKSLGFNLYECGPQEILAYKYCKQYNSNIYISVNFIGKGNHIHWLNLIISVN